ncbi:MAG: Na+/H+ antiporter NhaC family protein [candidate division KSB1 bacterium]|nr:Na+/H+ antiporter NhaC family protein [candidate division KSB1 bacterium]
MNQSTRIISFLLAVIPGWGFAQSQPALPTLKIETSQIVLQNVPFKISFSVQDEEGNLLSSVSDTLLVAGALATNGSPLPPVVLQKGRAEVSDAVFEKTGALKLTATGTRLAAEQRVRAIPAWLSLLPPLIAITIALVARQVLLSLFIGVWLGAVFIYEYNLLLGLMRTVDTYLVQVLTESSHISILVFSLTLGGMVGVISLGGGTQGIVEALSKFATSSRSGQVVSWAMGMLIFFDDYANTLIVGNTMRPVTDRLKISREKLSYIVDSTAAPIASIAPISTWIGYEVGLLDQTFKSLNLNLDPYLQFIAAIPYSDYSILTLIMVLIIALSRRDFGAMRTAEKRALHEGKVLRDNATPLTDAKSLEVHANSNIAKRWYNGIVPIFVVILITIVGLYYDGYASLGDNAATAKLKDIISAANSFNVLMWASFGGLFTAVIMVVAQRLMSLSKAIDAVVAGYRAMLMAAFILTLAWAIGKICVDLHTADYVVSLTRAVVSPKILPLLTFLIAGVLSFSTGSSWATMAIMIPIVIPMAHQLPLEQSLSADLSQHIFLGTIGAVLSGAVFGDHCSPISDTTVMSSMASAADHIDHVRTQLPYALAAGLVACLTGYLPAGFGWTGWLLLVLGIGALIGVVYLFGKRA